MIVLNTKQKDMAIKSVYHKTETRGAFPGNKFYTTNQDLQIADTVYVVSSTVTAGKLEAYLEGRFRVDDSIKGIFEIKGEKYKYESVLSEEVRPVNPVSLSDMCGKIGKRQFASRFMNVAKPNLDQVEISNFNNLLAGIKTRIPHQYLADGSLDVLV